MPDGSRRPPMPLRGPEADPITGRKNVHDWLLSIVASSSIVAIAVLSFDQCVHWYVLPILCCGILCGSDAVCWLRERYDTFDPKGTIGALGFHVFFLAPLLHLIWDQWMLKGLDRTALVPPPTDLRPWLGWMACLNFAGLLIYEVVHRFCLGVIAPSSRQWRVQAAPFPLIFGGAIFAVSAVQVFALSRLGGLRGLMAAASAGIVELRGWGMIFFFSESLPVLVLVAVLIGIICVCLFVLQVQYNC